MNEFDIIADIFAPLATVPGAFGLKDDGAIISPQPGFDLVVSTDQIAEGTDFFAHDPAGLVAKKALRVNLSDLAAKGAKPEFYCLVLALPPSITTDWLTAFAGGLAEDQRQYGISLLGGDTGRSEGPLSITITAFGFVPQGGMLRRNGARPGDAIYVTGTIGDSGGGLAIFRRENHTLSDTDRDYLVGRYRLPEPPIEFGTRLANFASASIDVSDGLVADLGHVATASGVRLTIDAVAVPRSEALRAFWGDAGIVRATTAGDDYQIAFTADPACEADIMALAKATGIDVTRIGTVMAGEGVALMKDSEEVVLPHSGYRHF